MDHDHRRKQASRSQFQYLFGTEKTLVAYGYTPGVEKML